jgi:hypothetical protein
MLTYYPNIKIFSPSFSLITLYRFSMVLRRVFYVPFVDFKGYGSIMIK